MISWRFIWYHIGHLGPQSSIPKIPWQMLAVGHYNSLALREHLLHQIRPPFKYDGNTRAIDD